MLEFKDTMSERYGFQGLCVKKLTLLDEVGNPVISSYKPKFLTVVQGGLFTANFYLEAFPETRSTSFEIYVPKFFN
jgi:hypothetical protein